MTRRGEDVAADHGRSPMRRMVGAAERKTAQCSELRQSGSAMTSKWEQASSTSIAGARHRAGGLIGDVALVGAERDTRGTALGWSRQSRSSPSLGTLTCVGCALVVGGLRWSVQATRQTTLRAWNSKRSRTVPLRTKGSQARGIRPTRFPRVSSDVKTTLARRAVACCVRAERCGLPSVRGQQLR